VPKAQTLTLAHFSSLYTLGTFYKLPEGANLMYSISKKPTKHTRRHKKILS
jgi:hypothetical protein